MVHASLDGDRLFQGDTVKCGPMRADKLGQQGSAGRQRPEPHVLAVLTHQHQRQRTCMSSRLPHVMTLAVVWGHKVRIRWGYLMLKTPMLDLFWHIHATSSLEDPGSGGSTTGWGSVWDMPGHASTRCESEVGDKDIPPKVRGRDLSKCIQWRHKTTAATSK